MGFWIVSLQLVSFTLPAGCGDATLPVLPVRWYDTYRSNTSYPKKSQAKTSDESECMNSDRIKFSSPC